MIGNALAHLRADEALAASRNETRQLAGRLLTAQEEERKRLAREMHDDVSQRLAANAIQVGKIEQQLMAADPARPALASVKEQLSDLSQDVHRISRQLHPSILVDLGLSDAIRSECERRESQSQIAVDFCGGELPDGIPNDVALSPDGCRGATQPPGAGKKIQTQYVVKPLSAFLGQISQPACSSPIRSIATC